MLRSNRYCAWLATVACLSVSATARADEAADTAAARLLGVDGITLADAGNCEQAIEKLRRAEGLHHAPTTAARLGECEIGVGRIVQGTERLQRLLREPLAPGAPAPFVDAVARARRVLERALPKIATMRVKVTAPPGAKFQVKVDGEPMPEALVDNNRPSDPGHHAVEVSGPGLLPSRQELTLGDGESADVSLELTPDPTPPPVAAPTVEPSQPAETLAARPAPRPNSGPGAAPIVALSLAGVGLAAGIGAGSLVALDSADLSKSCSAGRVCPSNKASEIASAKTWATVSTVGFGVAGAGAVAAIILVLAHRQAPERLTQARLEPLVGPAFIGCEGAF